MTTKNLTKIDDLINRLEGLPDIVDIRIKTKWKEIDQAERDLLFQTYKDLDDLLNDTLAFINVNFPNRDDLKNQWTRIDFDPKLGSFKVETNSPELIRSNWLEGMKTFENLLKNLRREIILSIENNSTQKENPTKKKLELSHKIALASLAVAFIVLIFGNNLLDKFSSSPKQQEIVSNTQVQKSIDTTVLIVMLPYLENYPIIDSGLYLRYNFNNLILGGVNLDSIRINARTISSEPMEIKKEERVLILDITEEPFIEFAYKGKFYSVKINGQHHEFKMTLREIAKPTMAMKEY